MSALPARMPLDAILRRSRLAEARPLIWPNGPVDRSRWFLCETLTPLYFAPIYLELSDEDRRRYNQLTGLCFNELIAFFEESFAASVLAAVADARRNADRGFAECLDGFLREEQRHIGYWRELNRLSEPDWYSDGRHNAVLRISAAARRFLRLMTTRPVQFPVVFWVMLALEERSIDVSRRCLRVSPTTIAPHYRELYRLHLQDETRHVQLDLHLIYKFYASLPVRWRRVNAKLLAILIGRFFLPPTRSAVRVVRLLAAERPQLASRLPEMIRQLRCVGEDGAYHEMMYSRRTTPITFALFDHFEEMHGMSRVLKSYRPPSSATQERRTKEISRAEAGYGDD